MVLSVLRSEKQEDIHASHHEQWTKGNQVFKAETLRANMLCVVKPLMEKCADREPDEKLIKRLSERLTITENYRAKYSSLSCSFPWPIEKAISELLVEMRAIQQVAEDYIKILNEERRVKSIRSKLLERKKELIAQIKTTEPILQRFMQAQAVLDDICTNHSLTDAMKATLQINRSAIESIFTKIHSPPEFQGLGANLATLIRKDCTQEAALSEISTGQRSAYALSIFLAQNAQLTVAPRILLIDDPIAHVDDLNSLSFLDYLREVAVTGDRQIFFATASEKLAGLFMRKFSFLGENDFRTFNFTREVSNPEPVK